MIIGMGCTKNWYKYMLTNLYAILTNNKVEKIYLFIEDDSIDGLDLLSEKFKTEFVCINMNKIFNKYIKEDSPNINTKYTKCSMARLFFPNEVKEDKILYIDVDALVVSNLDELWNLNIDEYYIAGTTDSGMMKDGVVYLKFINANIPYVNSGVLLMNLKHIREDKIDKKWLNIINKERLMYPDQDSINVSCKDHIFIFDPKFNSSLSTTLLKNKKDIKIMHYTMAKVDWVRNHKFSELWYDYENKYEKFKEQCKTN